MPDHRSPTMLDRGAFWTPVPDWTSARVQGEGWCAAAVTGLHRMLVSGDLDAAQREIAPGAGSIGLWEVNNGSPVLVRIGRDRGLILGTEPFLAISGWSTNGFAASPADDGFTTIEIKGPGLRELVSEMTFTDLDAGSPSAATLLCGHPALLHRRSEERAWIHVEAPLAAVYWHWLVQHE